MGWVDDIKITELKQASQEKLSTERKHFINAFKIILYMLKPYEGLVLIQQDESPLATAYCGRIKTILGDNFEVQILFEHVEYNQRDKSYTLVGVLPKFREEFLVGIQLSYNSEPCINPNYYNTEMKELKLEEFDNFFSDYLKKHFVIL